MRVVVSRDSRRGQGIRGHYCTELGDTVGILVEGLQQKADIFCPICGALAPWDGDQHLFNGPPHLDDYNGPLCEHGRPDTRCADLASEDKWLAFALGSTHAIREYTAAAVATRHNCAPDVIDWVRYCGECRKVIAQAKLPALRHELTLLRAKVAEESRHAQRALTALAEDIRGLNMAAEVLNEIATAAQATPDFSRPGFVYLIGHSSALKIGWTEKHPAKGRLNQLQTATEQDLELLSYMLGTVEDEHQLHNRFAAHHIRGEWFHRAQEILAYFQENRQ